ncbi:NAD(P)H-hydrate dehydratase [uncultured Neptuniibacter sp.]|uniref:NAD(P)H-hydrate dehydratase n=1 Tax=uncultured Neptuniibacter sp. TaxID=502143 RepID=UPI00260C2986|nr:NAD(P)H-hydrate dehydratase [uncultured Neptuniibacter sp.]
MSVNRTVLPAPLYTAEQTRVLDKTAIEQFSIPGIRLMQRAGHAVFAEMIERFPALSSVTVICGGGNNGGDGFVVAGLAHNKGLKVQLICVGGEDFAQRLQGEAALAWQQLQQISSAYELFNAGIEIEGDCIIDALLGTGLTGQVRSPFNQVIDLINRAPKPVIAVDIPSGLCADSGRVLGVAVKADLTLSFIGLKRGLLTSEAVDHCGLILFDGLKVPEEVYDQVPVNVFRTTQEDLTEYLPPRPKGSHKGKFGHLLVIGGNLGMGGAALLASDAAMRSGAGLVSLATRVEHLSASLARSPEVMVHGVESTGALLPLLEKADVIVLGPGLGQNAWSDQMLHAVLGVDIPLVLDADALNLLAANGKLPQLQRENWIITPHPGEASRLLASSVAEINQDRFLSVALLQKLCGGSVVLKGAGSLVNAGDATYLCDAGNPGMAVAGMGDVLSGICGAFLAQGLTAETAARLAVYVHATAADLVARRQGEIGMKASDLINEIPGVINNTYE